LPNSLNFFAVFGPKNGDFETQKRYIEPTHFAPFGKTAGAVPDSTVFFAYRRISDSSYVRAIALPHTVGIAGHYLQRVPLGGPSCCGSIASFAVAPFRLHTPYRACALAQAPCYKHNVQRPSSLPASVFLPAS